MPALSTHTHCPQHRTGQGLQSPGWESEGWHCQAGAELGPSPALGFPVCKSRAVKEGVQGNQVLDVGPRAGARGSSSLPPAHPAHAWNRAHVCFMYSSSQKLPHVPWSQLASIPEHWPLVAWVPHLLAAPQPLLPRKQEGFPEPQITCCPAAGGDP